MKKIPLSKGYTATIDDDDFGVVSNYSWSVSSIRAVIYAQAALPKNGLSKHRNILMHRLIMGVTDSRLKVDHIDHDGLNNRRQNLRLATESQNGANRRKTKGATTSQYKGVTPGEGLGFLRWKAQIRKKGKLIHLGYYEFEIAAARAYDLAAVDYFGEFALLNLPEEWE